LPRDFLRVNRETAIRTHDGDGLADMDFRAMRYIDGRHIHRDSSEDWRVSTGDDNSATIRKAVRYSVCIAYGKYRDAHWRRGREDASVSYPRPAGFP